MPISFGTSPASAPADAGATNRTRIARWRVTTAPVARPVTWAEAKAHMRLSSDDEQTYVETLIDAATDYAETRMAAALMEQTILATFYDGMPLDLPRGPLLSISAITDRDDAAVTDYDLKHTGHTARVILNTAAAYPISISYRAGHLTANAIPAAIRLAILAHVGSLYENRESISDKSKMPVPHQLDAFYRLKSRTVGIG